MRELSAHQPEVRRIAVWAEQRATTSPRQPRGDAAGKVALTSGVRIFDMLAKLAVAAAAKLADIDPATLSVAAFAGSLVVCGAGGGTATQPIVGKSRVQELSIASPAVD